MQKDAGGHAFQFLQTLFQRWWQSLSYGLKIQVLTRHARVVQVNRLARALTIVSAS